MIWCSLSIIFFRFVKFKNSEKFAPIVVPNLRLIFISYLLIIFILPDLILTKLGMVDHSKLHIIENNVFIDSIYSYDKNNFIIQFF